MKNINAITAILLALKNIGNEEFSIFNITLEIRDQLYLGIYQIDSANFIPHEEVKKNFEELQLMGLLDDYTVSHSVDGYRLYQLKQVIVNIPDASVPTPTQSALDRVQAISRASIIPMDIQKKIYAYLKGNGSVSMKQIQSCLKNQPYTCKDIKTFLGQLQLIDPNTATLPDSQSKTIKI